MGTSGSTQLERRRPRRRIRPNARNGDEDVAAPEAAQHSAAIYDEDGAIIF
jgi:hypothetical protein